MDKKLIKEVKDLINEVDRTHRYSMSKIYGLTNKVFNRNEQPQSCASCLIRKVNELKQWLDQQERLSDIQEKMKTDLSPVNIESVDLIKKSKRKRKEA